nr:MAG TPA: hypothetical protein [Caudoviricetes sp.]
MRHIVVSVPIWKTSFIRCLHKLNILPNTQANTLAGSLSRFTMMCEPSKVRSSSEG